MVPEEQSERPWSPSTVHSSHILCPSPLGPGPSQVEARIARLVLGINNSSRRITTLVSAIAKTYFILTWSKVSKHKAIPARPRAVCGKEGGKKEHMKRKGLSARPKKLPNTICLHIQYTPPTPPLHLRSGGDGEKTKIREGVKSNSRTLRSQGPTRIEIAPPG